MIYGILRIEDKNKHEVKELTENLKITTGIPLYYRIIIDWGYIRQFEIAIARMTQYQVDCIKDLGYNIRLTTLSRKERNKRFKILKINQLKPKVHEKNKCKKSYTSSKEEESSTCY
ncbi:MAG TPA: hypothetical protein PLG47_05110 [Candidatus Dojkabacteria bacterium]|nr:hypothetical protein [Candidatus Dojkabacteria bacterium]